MVDVMQKSVLVPYDKYQRLLSLQESHQEDFKQNSTETPENKPEDMTKPDELQQETNNQSSQTENLVDSETKEDFLRTSPEPLMKIQPALQKTLKIAKKILKSAKKPYSRYRLNKTWIQF